MIRKIVWRRWCDIRKQKSDWCASGASKYPKGLQQQERGTGKVQSYLKPGNKQVKTKQSLFGINMTYLKEEK